MKEKQNKKDAKLFKEVINLIKTPRGKAVLFFGIYVVFFIVLAIVSRIRGSGDIIGSKVNITPYSYNLSSISSNNYYFQYQYQIDERMLSFTGARNGDKSLFSDGIISYYQNDTLFIRHQDGIWIKCDTPYIFPFLLDSSVMQELINAATYISKTQLATGEEEVNFQISTTTLVKLLDNMDVDLDEPVNTIQLRKTSTGDVNQIIYDFSSYAVYKKVAVAKFQLVLSYSDFNKVKEIEDPS